MSNPAAAQANITDKDPNAEIYDALPYDSYTYHNTHPDHLYVMGRLFGLTPPDYKTARVLELGGASGGNRLPFAHDFPQSECVGIDLAADQIKTARAMQEKLGVKNARFEVRNILDLSKEEFGTFDYIICHGILSWVPENVQQKIFEICGSMLTPEGMAIISYNALPGWHYVRPIRDLMMHFTQGITDPRGKAAKAMSMLHFLADHIPDASDLHKAVIRKEKALLAESFENFILFDHLGPFNYSFYLKDINEKLAANGLQYVSDAELGTEYMGAFSAEAQTMAKSFKTRVEKIQFRDFLSGQRFRTTIITKSAKKIRDRIDPAILLDGYVTINAQPAEENPDPAGEIHYHKRNDVNAGFSIRERDANEIILELCYRGVHPVKTGELLRAAAENLEGADEKSLRQTAKSQLGDLLDAGYVTLFDAPPGATLHLSDKPVAYPPARLHAQMYPQSKLLVNASRFCIDTTRFGNDIAALMDGTRTMDEIQDIMMKKMQDGGFTMKGQNGLPITDPVQQKIALQGIIMQTAHQLAEAGILVG